MNAVEIALVNAQPAVVDIPHAVTRRIADIPAEPLAWLWPGRIPLGKVTILSGDPGLGKSLVTLAVAATVSRGAPWPCHEGTAQRGDVVLVSAEDDAGDTIRPRLEAAGADLGRIHVLDGIEYTDENGKLLCRPWNFTDTDALAARLAVLPECRLVVVDPLSAYLGGTDSHKNADVRALLTPLAEMASRQSVAILCVSHLNKSAGPAIYRTSGSLAFVAAARAAYAVAKDQNDASRRLVVPIKCNLAPDSTGLAYRVATGANEAPVVEWEALAAPAREDEQGETGNAARWLRDALSDGPVEVSTLKHLAAEEGLAWRTLQRAMGHAGVESRRGGFGQSATWGLHSRANRPQAQKVGANGANGATVENIGLAGRSTDPVTPVAPTLARGATVLDEGEL